MVYNEATGEWATEIVTLTWKRMSHVSHNMDTGLMDLEESSQLDSQVHSNISQPETSITIAS